jgi:hypothetical protein
VTAASDARNGRDVVTGAVTQPMSAAERQRRYRARRRQEKERQAPAGSGLQADGEWVAQFPGQRPPFAPGNELSLTSGAFSPRRLLPLAEEIAAALLADSDAPDYLQSPSYRPAVMAWARAEAQVRLLSEYLSSLELDAALAELTAGTETEVRGCAGAADAADGAAAGRVGVGGTSQG